MNDVDTAVRAMLTDRAGDVSEVPGLLDGVHRRVRRKRNRKLAATGVAVVLALVVTGVVGWSVERDDRLVPTERPTASPTAESSPSPRGASAPASPVSLGRLPAGFTRPLASLDSVHSWTLRTTRNAPPATVEVQISTVPLTTRTGPGAPQAKFGTTRQIGLGGGTATYYSVPHRPDWQDADHQGYLGAYSELTFARRPGQWIRIEAYGGPDDSSSDPRVTEADLLTIADGLVDRAMPLPDRLRFPPLPAGLTFGSTDDGGDGQGPSVQLVDPAAPADSTNRPYGGSQWELRRAPIVVLVVPKTFSPAALLASDVSRPTVLRVDGHEVVRYPPGYPDRRVLTTSFGPDRVIGLTAADSLGLSDEQLARFLLGIRPGAEFR
ncbi:hypothetical protein [Cryptosporangium minutisporangium]|uniref:Uncharacterized protein n=1 Tax=Cryptosporangium minutisporangium TaxID=113569 RepID=A0ABP6SQ31_9ACTN